MKDKAFLDTNILIYGYSVTEKKKQKIVSNLPKFADTVVSLQVIQEFTNVLHKKFAIDWDNIMAAIAEIEEYNLIHINSLKTILKACEISEKYLFSFYDSLIISAALESDCKILYSEDLNHNQLIENQLRIINPFK
jgi:predicted nucleic acid-binding protein